MKGEHIYVEHPRDTSARMNTLHGIYFNIAQEEYIKCLDVEDTDISGMHEGEKMELSYKSTGHAIKAIVFSSMCVESAINNYAGTQLGDNYYDNHLNNLDVLSKWVVIPDLVCGKSIDKSGPAYNSLKKLIKARNKLVHNKSKEYNPTDPNLYKHLEKSEVDFKNDFENSLKALYLLRMEMDFVLGQAHNPIGTLDPAFTWFEIPEQVKDIFNRCKSIVLKQYS
ncbi:hypothetical protein [Shewanella vesiculosa]|uniref:hypothetical protein n=1 Tax=Shewanella vesiculosa TaxID=518738 RepID=UPI00384D3CBF